MAEEENKPESEQPAAETGADQSTKQDALSKTDEELSKDLAENAAANGTTETDDEEPAKKINPLKAFFRKVNLYLLLFLLIAIVSGAVTIVSYLNSKKAPKAASVASQQLNQDALKKLANSDTTIGNSAQTLTVQGNAVFSGQVLVRSDLNVAGSIQLGGALLAPSLTVSGKTNLGDTQINNVQVATNLAVQGSTTLKDLNVAGSTSLGGNVTASQITVTKLILSGNAVLQVPNHLAFTGAPATRTSIDNTVLGAGGTASISGSDTAGTVSVNSGNNPTTGCAIKVAFAQPYTSQPHLTLGPIGVGAGQSDYYATRTTAGFSICFGSAPPANQQFAFDYFVTN